MPCMQKFCFPTSWQNTTFSSCMVAQVAHCFTRLCEAMFPDSKFTSMFACGRTKTTQIVKQFPCTILTSRSRGTFVIQFLLPSQWWEQWQKLWQVLVHTTAIFQTDHNQLPCHAHLQHRYCSKHNRCSSTTTSHSPTSSPSCPTTAV